MFCIRHFQENNDTSKRHLPLGRYLVFALLVMVLSSATTYGYYASQATGSDRAQVAKFAVTITAPDTTATITNDGSDEAAYTVTFVNNASEVTVKHYIEVTNIPSGVKVKLGTGAYQTPMNNKVTFQCNTLASGQQKYTLTFKADDGAKTVSNSQITITGFAEQVD